MRQTPREDYTPAPGERNSSASRLRDGSAAVLTEDIASNRSAVAVLIYGPAARFGGTPASARPFSEDCTFTVLGIASQALRHHHPIGRYLDPIASACCCGPTIVVSCRAKPDVCFLARRRLVPGRRRTGAGERLLDRLRAGRDTTQAGSIDGTQAYADRAAGRPTLRPASGGALVLCWPAPTWETCSSRGPGANAVRLPVAWHWRQPATFVRSSHKASRSRFSRGCGLMVSFWLPVNRDSSGSSALNFGGCRRAAYALGLSLLSCIVFGLAPALHGTRSSVGNALKAEIPTAGSRLPLRNLLLAVQVAATVILLAASAILTRALYDASMRDHGFSMQNVSVVSFETPRAGTTRRNPGRRARARQRRGAAGDSQTVRSHRRSLWVGNIRAASGSPECSGPVQLVYEVSPPIRFLGSMLSPDGRWSRRQNRPSSSSARRWRRNTGPCPRVGSESSSIRAGGWNTPGELEIVGVVKDIHRRASRSPIPRSTSPCPAASLPRVLAGARASRQPRRDAAAARSSAAAARVTSLAANLGPR